MLGDFVACRDLLVTNAACLEKNKSLAWDSCVLAGPASFSAGRVYCKAAWLAFSCADEGQTFLSFFFKTFVSVLTHFFELPWQILQRTTANECATSFSQVSCHTVTFSAGWQPDFQRPITNMKTRPAVYLIKSILTAVRLPSAVNNDWLQTFLQNIKVYVCNFVLLETVLLEVWGSCRHPHTSHTQCNEDQELDSCSPWAFLPGAHLFTQWETIKIRVM